MVRTRPLVDAAALLAREGRDDLVVLDCRHSLSDPDAGARLYAAGHIPGASHAHVDRDLSGPVGPRTGRHPLPEPETFVETARGWGVDPDTLVVAYDDAGGAWAARVWWLLRHYGHANVAVLDGGLRAYLEAGGTLTTEGAPARRGTFEGRPGHLPTVDAETLATRLPATRGTLIDARDAERYRGEVEPIDPVAGHIPGAVNVPYKGNLDADGRFLTPEALRERFHAATGDMDPADVTVYCGSGVTAAQDLLAMEVAGLPGAALYPGSWSEWSRNGRPAERGAGRR